MLTSQSSVNDFSLSQVARGLGKKDETVKYLNRSRNWRHHWNPDAETLGFKGFLVPRTKDAFVIQDPLSCGGCYWGDNCKIPLQTDWRII